MQVGVAVEVGAAHVDGQRTDVRQVQVEAVERGRRCPVKYRSQPLPMTLLQPTTLHTSPAESSVTVVFSRDDPAGRTPTYAPPLRQSLPGDPTRMVLADLTGHKRHDLVVLIPSAKSIAVALAKPDGSGFEAPQVYPVGPNLTDVAAGDLTGDGVDDVVVSSTMGDDGLLTTLRNDGHGHLSVAGTSSGPSHYSAVLSVTLPRA